MRFGYFTLSDNRYPALGRSPERFVLDIREQAIAADRLGFHSAWIGEHHFDSLGVNSSPHTLLASIAPVTSRIRLAPAVAVLPLHHPLRVAEDWATLDLISGGRVDFAAGRGYDRREYVPFGADYMRSLELLDESAEVLVRAWGQEAPFSYRGRFFDIPEMTLTPRPIQRPLPFYMACFSASSMEIAGRLGLDIIFAPFAAEITFGGLAPAVAAFHATRARHGKPGGVAKCSYFIHIADTPAEDDFGRECLMRYFENAVKPAFVQEPGKTPPTMAYFARINEILAGMRKETLSDKSILLGPPERIIETLRRVEAAGIDEVILYFNVGGKPHEMVLQQMERFMRDVAPAFA
jgi:alkanesulfonate monooxygenase SsuD/methylene tetrahydromethanopterin reductase-like flavin-dependent oxidoreductase (luciferase family)